jgi:predicted nuclease with TOPRIM domain
LINAKLTTVRISVAAIPEIKAQLDELQDRIEALSTKNAELVAKLEEADDWNEEILSRIGGTL